MFSPRDPIYSPTEEEEVCVWGGGGKERGGEEGEGNIPFPFSWSQYSFPRYKV